MQAAIREKPSAASVVFDTALSRADDALALALLFGFDGKKNVRVVSVSVSRANLNAAIYCDVVGRFYAGAVSGAIGFNGRTLPVGLVSEAPLKKDEPLFTVPLQKKMADGKSAYDTDIHRMEDTADVDTVIRNALTAQYDNNCIVIMAGPATGLAQLLELPGAKDVIARKVKFLVAAAPELNILNDIQAAKKVFAEWPTPIVASGYEIGEKLLYPASSIESDFAWSLDHPVADAYRVYKPMPYDSPTYSMSAVLYASRPQEGYFGLSDAGAISVGDDGRFSFTSVPNGRHRHLIFDPEQHDRILKVYEEVASARPVARPQPNFQKPQQQQKAPVVEVKPAP